MRVIVKIGTSSLTSESGQVNTAALSKLVSEVVAARAQGIELVVVTSGAITGVTTASITVACNDGYGPGGDAICQTDGSFTDVTCAGVPALAGTGPWKLARRETGGEGRASRDDLPIVELHL